MIQYATKNQRHDGKGTYYGDIYTSVGQVEMCTEPDTPIYEIELTETTTPTEDSYYGWSDDYDEICLVYPVFFLMNMCFPYGAKADESHGRGRIIRVNVREIREVTP